MLLWYVVIRFLTRVAERPLPHPGSPGRLVCNILVYRPGNDEPERSDNRSLAIAAH